MSSFCPAGLVPCGRVRPSCTEGLPHRSIFLPLQARLAATGRLIDLIVYRLYGLTDEEAAIVEGRLR